MTTSVAERPERVDRVVVGRAARAYLAIALVLTALTILANSYSGGDAGLKSIIDRLGLAGGWCRFDCGWYVGIAEQGYFYNPGYESSVAFFPGYPMAARGLGNIIGDIPLAVIITSWLSGFGAVIAYAAWCTGRLDRRVATWSVAVLLLYPYGFFLFGAGYGDGLFLALAVSAFLLLERDHLFLAALAGALAGATRSIGIVIFVSMVLVIIDRRGGMPMRAPDSGWLAKLGLPASVSLKVLRGRDAFLFIALLGPIGWSLFLNNRFGDGFAYVTVQEAWKQKAGPETWLKFDLFRELANGQDIYYVGSRLIQAGLLVVLLALLPLVAKKLGPGYAAYSAAAVLLAALSNKDFQSVGRYAIAAFPIFVVVGIELSARPRWGRLVLVLGAIFLCAGAFGFARGFYLS